jgi:NADH dehydrogenase
MAEPRKTHILILGAGFGGFYAAMRLDRTLARDPDVQVTLVDKDNFSLFTPMLHEVAASDLDPSDIVNPLRKMLRRVTFYEAKVQSIDLHAKSVTTCFGLQQRERVLHYDHLVLAMGSETRFFDDETRKHAITMKSLGDALFLRNRLIGLLEAAAVEEDPEVRRQTLTLVVAGGGFAGVETIGAVNDFLRDALKYYPQLKEEMLSVVLVHPGNVLLPEFAPSLGKYTGEKLRQAKIEVRLDTSVESYDGATVKLKPAPPPHKNPEHKPEHHADPSPRPENLHQDITAHTLVWTAGVTPPPLIQSLPLQKEKGRVVVQSTMESAEFPGVWALGDCAHIPDPKTGKAFPATAQHATREAVRLAKNIKASIRGGAPRPFTFKTLGQLAAIGKRRGAAQILGFNFSGFIAWFMWRTIYWWKLPTLEKKIRVGMSWGLDLFFSKDIVQIITPDEVRRLSKTDAGQRSPAPAHSESESFAESAP